MFVFVFLALKGSFQDQNKERSLVETRFKVLKVHFAFSFKENGLVPLEVR